MRRNVKRFVLLFLSITMIMSSSVSVRAESLGQGSETGIGEVEGSVKTDIYQVILPTETDGIFDFILDP